MDIRGFPRNFTTATQALAEWSAVFQREGSGFHKVLKAADLDEARRLGKLGVILACQDAAILTVEGLAAEGELLQHRGA